jgi:hypothetical protein
MKLTVQNDNTIQLVPTGEPFALFQYEGFFIALSCLKLAKRHLMFALKRFSFAPTL